MKEANILIINMYPVDVRNIIIWIAKMRLMDRPLAFIVPEFYSPDEHESHKPNQDLLSLQGLIGMTFNKPDNDTRWQHFQHDVINTFQRAEFDGVPHIGPNSSLDQVHTLAGNHAELSPENISYSF